MLPILIIVVIFVIAIVLIIPLTDYRNKSLHSYYKDIRWKFDKEDAETQDVTESDEPEQEEEEVEYQKHHTPFTIQEIIQLVLSFSVLTAVSLFVTSLFADFTSYASEANISSVTTQNTISVLDGFVDFMPYITLTIICAMFIGILLRIFFNFVQE